MKLLITGGAGFIGSALVRAALHQPGCEVVNVDKLTYAGNPLSLAEIDERREYSFVQADINDFGLLAEIFREYEPDAVLHLAAETHVDRSIDSASDFVSTNVNGTCCLLDVALEYWRDLPNLRRNHFRFVYVSTDEVFGDLGESEARFSESSVYAPSSPYSATKAAADHLARAWHRTYGLPTIVVNCSNAYGPYQFPEKFIPHVILSAIQGRSLPLYGDGQHMRDWNHVTDLVEALLLVANSGQAGESYAIGTGKSVSNLSVVESLCDILDKHESVASNSHRDLIKFVEERPGHDRRYCVDSGKIQAELNWYPRTDFRMGLQSTVDWYLANESWWQNILSGDYRLTRLGTGS